MNRILPRFRSFICGMTALAISNGKTTISSSAERMSSGLAVSTGARTAAPASLQMTTSTRPSVAVAVATIWAGV